MLSDSSSDDSEADSSREDEEEEKEASPLAGEEKKRKAAPTREAGGSKKGRTLPPDYSTNADDAKRSGHRGLSPWRDRKYPDTRITHGISFVGQNLLMPNITLQPAQERARHFNERLPGFVGRE